jgi:hypothetical protein
MLTVVQRLVIVGVEQPLQDLDGFLARRCGVEVAVLLYEMLVPRGDITAACVAHRSAPEFTISAIGCQDLVEQGPRLCCFFVGHLLNCIANMHENVVPGLEVFILQHEQAYLALDPAGLAGTLEAVDRGYFHWDGEAHGLTPDSACRLAINSMTLILVAGSGAMLYVISPIPVGRLRVYL